MSGDTARDLGRTEFGKAKNIFLRYVILLVVIYIGFVIMSELLEQDNESVRWIEFALVSMIMGCLVVVFYKVVKALTYYKRADKWK